jgi:hypothetical protein
MHVLKICRHAGANPLTGTVHEVNKNDLSLYEIRIESNTIPLMRYDRKIREPIGREVLIFSEYWGHGGE